MKTTILPIAARPVILLAIAAAMPGHAAAQAAGDIQVKLLGTLVAPDGRITRVKHDAIGLPAGSQAKANDNAIPTVAIEYFLGPNLSVETIAGVTQHDVDGAGALKGAELVSDAKVVPATLTLKYHFGKPGGVRPYLGAGPSYYIFIDEKPGATTRTLGATRQRIDDTLGLAMQAGVDVPLNANGLALSLDAKRYLLRPTAHWFAGGAEVLTTKHRLDPWVVSAGVAVRF